MAKRAVGLKDLLSSLDGLQIQCLRGAGGRWSGGNGRCCRRLGGKVAGKTYDGPGYTGGYTENLNDAVHLTKSS
jgi:hypothetical protein